MGNYDSIVKILSVERRETWLALEKYLKQIEFVLVFPSLPDRDKYSSFPFLFSPQPLFSFSLVASECLILLATNYELKKMIFLFLIIINEEDTIIPFTEVRRLSYEITFPKII